MKIIPANSSSALGSALRSERRTQGLTQEELAALAGVGVVTIYNIERGKPTTRLDAILRVASALGLHLALTSASDAAGNDG